MAPSAAPIKIYESEEQALRRDRLQSSTNISSTGFRGNVGPNSTVHIAVIGQLTNIASNQALLSPTAGFPAEDSPIRISLSDQMAVIRMKELPLANSRFEGREDYLDEIAKALENKKEGIIGGSIAGLGGMGKTELAIQYASRAKDKKTVGGIMLDYAGIYWLDGQKLSLTFRVLARSLNLREEDYEKFSKLVDALYAKLAELYEDKKWLLILDDVESYEAIKDYLPETRNPFRHILMTTRYQAYALPKIDVISLNSLNPNESIQLIKKWLPEKSHESADILAGELHHFPLALTQAAAYIATRPLISIEDYLRDYRSCKSAQLGYLKREVPESFNVLKEDHEKRAVYTSWYLSIKKLSDSDQGDLAIRILNHSAYLLPLEIPSEWMEKLLSCTTLDVNHAINLLLGQSLIQLNEQSKCYNIHQLLQEVIQLHEANEEAKYIKPLISVLSHKLKSDEYEIIKDQKLLFKHLDHLIDLIIKKASLKDLIIEFKSLVVRVARVHEIIGDHESLSQAKKYWHYLLVLQDDDETIAHAEALRGLASVEGALGGHDKEKELLEKALKIQIAYYPKEECVEVARTLDNLAEAYYGLGNMSEAEKLLIRALGIKKKYYKPPNENNVDIAITLSILSKVYATIGNENMPKAIKLLEEALQIKRARYGEKHMEVARTLHDLANVGGDLRDYKKKKEFLVQVLEIYSAHYITEESESIAKALNDLAEACKELKELDEAEKSFRKALEIKKYLFQTGKHTEIAITLTGLADVYFKKQRHDDARKILEEAIYNFEDPATQSNPYYLEKAKRLMADIEAIKKLKSKFSQVMLRGLLGGHQSRQAMLSQLLPVDLYRLKLYK